MGRGLGVMSKVNYKRYINKHEAKVDPYEQYGSELIKWEWSRSEDGIISLLREGVEYSRFRVATAEEVKNTTKETIYMTAEPCPIKKNEKLVRIKD